MLRLAAALSGLGAALRGATAEMVSLQATVLRSAGPSLPRRKRRRRRSAALWPSDPGCNRRPGRRYPERGAKRGGVS